MEYKAKRLKIGKKCNNNCIFCSDLYIKEKYDKSLEEIKKELNELKEKKYSEIVLPCNTDIRKDFFEILEYAKNLGFRMTLETNGRMFCYKDFCGGVKYFVDKSCILYFGYDAERHDKITSVIGSFDQARTGEHNLRKLIPSSETFYLCTDDSRLFFDEPMEVVIEVTSRCNFDCRGCFNKASFARHGRAVKEMSTEFIKEIIDSIVESKIPRVRFSGGEPLLRNDLFELMAYAKSKGLRIWLNTNGTLINKKNINELEEYVENVLVPLNGYDEKSDYNWTKTKNSFRKRIKGIKILKRSRIPVIRAGSVATEDLIKNLDKIYEIVRGLQIDNWELWRPIPLKKEDDGFNDKHVEILINKLIRYSIKSKKLFSIANALPFCSSDAKKIDLIGMGAKYDDGHSRVIVNPSGFAKPSYFIHKNIGDPRDILKCWNHEFMKKMRDLELVPKECKSCQYLEKCKGGSRYIANLYFKNYRVKDPLMRANKVLK